MPPPSPLSPPTGATSSLCTQPPTGRGFNPAGTDACVPNEDAAIDFSFFHELMADVDFAEPALFPYKAAPQAAAPLSPSAARFFDFADTLAFDETLLLLPAVLSPPLVPDHAPAFAPSPPPPALSPPPPALSPPALAAPPAGCALTSTGRPRQRAPKTAVADECKDAKYYARRAKNTQAAALNRARQREQREREQAELAGLAQQRTALTDEVTLLHRELAALRAAVVARLPAAAPPPRFAPN